MGQAVNNQQVGSLVSVNTFSGNVNFALKDLPGKITCNSQRNDDVGCGPAFTASAFQAITQREDGSLIYKDATGLVRHFYENPNEVEAYVDEQGWNLYGIFGEYLYMDYNINSHPQYSFTADGKITGFGVRAMNGSYVSQFSMNYDRDGRVITEWVASGSSYKPDEYTYAYTADNKIQSVTNKAGVKFPRTSPRRPGNPLRRRQRRPERRRRTAPSWRP